MRKPNWKVGVALLAGMILAGCQSWQNSSPPGLSKWNSERRTLQEAKNDPFPSPQQVGLK